MRQRFGAAPPSELETVLEEGVAQAGLEAARALYPGCSTWNAPGILRSTH